MPNRPRDLIGYGRTPPQANWPGRARVAVQFVLNYEEGGENCVLHGDPGSEQFLSEIIGAAAYPDRHLSMESIYEYGSRAGVWRILREFERRGLPLTVFGMAPPTDRYVARGREGFVAESLPKSRRSHNFAGVATNLEPKAMVTVLLATVVVPLGLGIGLARFFPRTAPRLAAIADRLGSVVLLLGTVVLLALHGPKMLAVIGEGTVLAILVVIVFGLLFGELLGGPDRSIRGALASATVSRHPAIALLLASGAFPLQQPTVIGTVLIYLIASLLLPNLLMRWRK
jgi:hypothetical protein